MMRDDHHQNEDKRESWPLTIRLFHWLSAALIFFMLALGTTMVRIDDTGLRFDFYQMHKAMGIAVLALTVLRSLLRISLAASGPVVPGSIWQARAAAAVHIMLYLLIAGAGLSGWIMVSASPLPVPTSIFGLFDLPSLTGRDLATYTFAKSLHGWLTKALIGVVGLHIAAALKHHFKDKDTVLRRMLSS